MSGEEPIRADSPRGRTDARRPAGAPPCRECGTGAADERVFSSSAMATLAGEDSDLDLLVDPVPGVGNELLRVAGLAEELSELLEVRVDVVAASLLRDEVSASALVDAVAV